MSVAPFCVKFLLKKYFLPRCVFALCPPEKEKRAPERGAQSAISEQVPHCQIWTDKRRLSAAWDPRERHNDFRLSSRKSCAVSSAGVCHEGRPLLTMEDAQ